MSDPNLIDPEVFASEKQTLQGSFLLEELDERVRSHDYPANKQTKGVVYAERRTRPTAAFVSRFERQSRHAPDLPALHYAHAVSAR